MTSPSKKEPSARRARLLEELARAGRESSDAAVLYHSVLADSLGLGASDWKALGLLERDGPMTAGDLAEASGLAPASITGMLDRLERGGWIRRSKDPQDGRRVLVALDRKAAARFTRSTFGGLMRRLDEHYARYTDDELALILDALRGVARCQREATAELSASAGPVERRRRRG